MSDEHNTRRLETGSYEPTRYAKNPYETTAAHEVPPIPPPPPPPNKRPCWHIAVPILIGVALVVLIVVPSIVFSKQPIPTPSNHFDPGATAIAQTKATQSAATATASVPTPTPTQMLIPTPTVIVETPTPAPQSPTPYTANDIYHDFVNAGMNLEPPTVDNNWSAYQWYPLGGAVSWYDGPYSCGGCGGTSQTVEIAVFQSSQHILDDANQLKSDGFSGTYKNGCLLFWKAADGTPPDLQSYQNVMDTYCT
jgi:hypothetical protein